MVHKIIDWYTNSGVVQFFFWGPLVINAVFYPCHVALRVWGDRQKLNKQEKPYDAVTVGHVFKYLGATVLPVVNALCTIFHVLPVAWDFIYKKFAWLFKRRLADWKAED